MSLVGSVNTTPVAASALRATPSPAGTPAPAPQDSVSLDAGTRSLGSVVGRGAAVLGGAAAGLGTGLVAGSATQTVGGLATQLVLSAMPPLQVAPALSNLLNQGLTLGIGGGSLLALGAGVAAGAGIAWYAARGEEKVDDAMKATGVGPQGMAARFTAGLKESGAEVGSRIAAVQRAETFGQAATQGYEAGATLGGHIGMTAGKVQGALMGAAVGTVASLPLVAAVNGLVALPLPAMAVVALPVALVGMGLGATLGEAVGQVTGSVAGGALGAAGGAVYHAGHRLVGQDG